VRVGRQLTTKIAGSRLVELDTGHVPHTTQPERFAAELTCFANEVFANRTMEHATT
jgi:hypothetical protein